MAGLFTEAADRDYVLISHTVNRPLHSKLSRLIAAKKRNDKCTVFLTTWGGDPNGGYRAARCLRHHYKHVRLAVPSYCKSAGTLIAIAANELGIGDLGELGPLDIQVRKGSELQENSSGLDIMQALQAVTSHTQDTFHRLLVGTRNLGLSTKLCAEFAATVASGIAAPLIGQIDPIRLGEMQRATRVAFEYGQRLNGHASNLQEGALARLIGQYPAHGFVIDRKEATELFNKVTHLTDAERVFCDAFWALVEREQDDFDPIMIDPPTSTEVANENANGPIPQNEKSFVEEPNAGSDGGEPGRQRDSSDTTGTSGPGVPVRSIGSGRRGTKTRGTGSA
ncbi:hypothetical protein CSC75_16275 [Pseudoxanthomonas wuyuanensis]|nr:hypothetical protein CSC75_16275 [Pseudoxanthomonas wuyuanensis]